MRRGRTIAEINMIPLIDVALILVIVFMVLTPVLIQSQLTVKLPKATQGSSISAETTLQIQISEGGRMTLEGKPVSAEGLEKALVLKLGKAAQKSVLVQADRSVPVEKIVFVLDVAKKLGVGKLGIGVNPN